MKTATLGLACWLGAHLVAQAQAQPEFGVKGGLNLAALHAGPTWYEPYNPYLHAGVYYRLPVAGALALQPELLYSLQGGNISNTQAQYDVKLHYLVLPMLARLAVGKLVVEAGPQVGYLLGASRAGLVQASTASTPSVYASSRQSATGQYERADFGLAAGLGCKLRVLTVGGRCTYSLTEANNGQTLPSSPDNHLRNRVLQLYVAVPVSN